ncbi:PspC domain-containing protein [Acinetobacter sp. WCHAc010052]|jgi:phage shock protein PspC (stress-responsive transcriptional regulator)|uniref:PspC domain-containing protein n=1 Tax=Acinetobacter sp. WCHAc010052 TaxID=2004647 RepID=UPI000B3CF69A|nr:PspC domain-containing protein [Acinetobacter sp. WCHAc010052]AXY61259.1 PspC domain-containing protein [Acinetobacter sp. WCHAc010052]
MANIGLYRSYRQNMVAGVMGGIAERFGWNANLLRIIFVLISIMSAAFPGILVYLILWLVIPKKNESDTQHHGYARPVRTVQNESGSDRY